MSLSIFIASITRSLSPALTLSPSLTFIERITPGRGASTFETAATLIHEMCHQWARVNNFQDTARSGSYHNKLFREIAEGHGLEVELSRGRGWSVTTLKESTKELLQSFIKQNPIIPVYRVMPIKPKRVRNVSVRKYVCPDCEASVRATKAVNVVCGDCMKKMQEEKL